MNKSHGKHGLEWICIAREKERRDKDRDRDRGSDRARKCRENRSSEVIQVISTQFK